MPNFVVVDRAGTEHRIEARADATIMEAIRDAGVDDLLALCGGVCSCATCHVYLDAERAASFDVMSADENDLLDSSDHRTDQSRLSCQLRLSGDWPDMRVTIAPED